MSTAGTTQTSATPILDRQVPLPPPVTVASGVAVALAGWFGFVFLVCIVFIYWRTPFVLFLSQRLILDLEQAFPHGWSFVRLMWVTLAATALVFVATAIHELGHVLGGILAGFNFNSLRVARIQLDRPFRLSLYRGKSAGSGGWASMFPAKLDRLAMRAALLLFAGPAANLLTVAVMLMLPPAPLLLEFFLLCSLVLGVINLLPFRSGAFHTDGSRILMLLSNRARGERWVAMLRLSAELREGVMPESLSPTCLRKVTALQDKSPDTVMAYSLAYSAAFHQHKDLEAAQMLEVCLRYSSYAAPALRQALMSDAAVFAARRRCNVDLARQWLADLPESKEIPWLRPRVEAAILEAQGDMRGSLQKLEETKKLILAEPNQARREISLRFIQRWQSELKTQLGSST